MTGNLLTKAPLKAVLAARTSFSNIFLNDLNIRLDNQAVQFKYADDSTIIAPVWKEQGCSSNLVSQFLAWTERNSMSCNPVKCKELTFYTKGNNACYSPIAMIPRCNEVVILRVTFQCDNKFSTHVKNKLIKANKCLFVLRSLRKEGYKQTEIDLLFNTLVLPNIAYALSLYAASESELTPVQCFLDRCFKRKLTSKSISVYSILEKQDRNIFLKRYPILLAIHSCLLCHALNRPNTT